MWDEMMALNVRAACLVAQESAKLMVREMSTVRSC